MEFEDKIKIAVSHFREMVAEMADGEDINVGEYLDAVSISTAMMIYSTCKDKSDIDKRVNDFTKNFNGLVRSTISTLQENSKRQIVN